MCSADSDWAGLPREILAAIFNLAAVQPAAAAGQPPAGAATATAATAAVACARGAAPSLAEAARLRLALEGTCRAWRAVADDVPLRVSLGSSPLPPSGALLLPFLARRPLAALHFEAAPGLPGCRPGAVQQLAILVLGSEALAASAASSLLELAVHDYTCSRPLCALLPRFRQLSCVSLSGYAIDLDLEPLGRLPRLEALHIEAEGLPSLEALPPSLRRLSLSCFASSARLLLPSHLRLDSLACHCPLTSIFCALSRALETCARISLSAGSIHLLLRTDHNASGSNGALSAADPAAALVTEFAGQSRMRELRLEAPQGRLALALAPRVPAGANAVEQRAAPMRRGRPLDPGAVCDAAGGSGVAATCATACPTACAAPLLTLALTKAAA